LYVARTQAQANYWHTTFATSKDSAVVASNGVNALTGAVAYDPVAYILFNPKNSLGETTTALNTVLSLTSGQVSATLTGPGLMTVGTNTTGVAGVKFVNTLTADNIGATSASSETLTVYSDGTAGTGTITFRNVTTGATIGTASVTFTGSAASATSVSLSDTSVAVGTTTTISAVIKDSAGNVLQSLPTGQNIYVYASDTRVVSAGANSTNATQYAQIAAGTRNSSATACATATWASGRLSCTVTINDSATASITLRDSWTVAASSWVSDAVTVQGLGTQRVSLSVAFDKATYSAGELAIITFTAKDRAGNATTSTSAYTEVGSSLSLGTCLTGSTGCAGSAFTTTTAYNYSALGAESGIETRVVYMPGNSGTVTLSVKYTPDLASGLGVLTTATATAVISNPAEDAANAATAAANAATAAANAATAAAKAGETAAVAEAQAATAAAKAATAAAEAATDAAAEGIDAANAATDAANLAAEAADAATVAAEEARDAADAATAAVEELATQVATLMAALKAQLTTLANTVAKIAKKVKA
jgi:hypothetical protein